LVKSNVPRVSKDKKEMERLQTLGRVVSDLRHALPELKTDACEIE